MLSEIYGRALTAAGGACPIEAGLIGRLVDLECSHGRLPGDGTEPCGCWVEKKRRKPLITKKEAMKIAQNGKRRGRPPGSKNRPKPVVTRGDAEELLSQRIRREAQEELARLNRQVDEAQAILKALA